MESFDVIIIGAGPAGLKCAETLGNSEHKVLLIEKNSEIGPKVCAGGLTEKSIEYLNLPHGLIEFHFKEIKLHVNNTTSKIKHENNFVFTIDRKNLGQWQLMKLKQYKNIEILKNSKVSKIEKNYVVVNGKNIKYNFLVGADGSTSVVKKYLGIKFKNVGTAIQYVVPTKKYKELEIFFESKLFSAWYAWIFPHEDYVSIGCGCNPKILSLRELTDNFQDWLDKNNIDISKGKYEAFTLNYEFRGLRFENVFLVGDAGGFVSDLTGEGIYQALVSGEEVGKTILNRKHKSDKINDLLRIKKIQNRLLRLLIKSGKLRTSVFYMGMMLLKIPYFRKKAIHLLA